MKALVAFFSASGVTRQLAERIARVADAEIYEIEPEQKYTKADLDWTNKQSRSSVEMQDRTYRPPIRKKDLDLSKYDMIFIGFPIWWYTCPTIVNTFMETFDFNGKTLVPFATSGVSGIEKACSDLKSTYPLVNWREGRLFSMVSDEELESWTKAI